MIERKSWCVEKYRLTRDATLKTCVGLKIEDFTVQSAPEVSPPKWHLAHTTWFFEEFILVKYLSNYKRFNADYSLLFNSYYKSVGTHWKQESRGLLSRPTVQEILSYRNYVDRAMLSLLELTESIDEVESLLEVGLNHEQQHQELLLMDIKHILSLGPIDSVYSQKRLENFSAGSLKWRHFKEGLYTFGQDESEFSYDNEGPAHKRYLTSFAIRESYISNGEYLEFINSGGYQNFQYWLSDGWDWINEQRIITPLYWRLIDGQWYEFSLHGLVPLDMYAPVSHISLYEAQAFAKWAGHRLPTEFELELALGDKKLPLWCWSSSHYSPYPAYESYKGELGEYNSKFMCNQFVLRGGCFATPEEHYRKTYRNFYRAHLRWMFAGIRIAKDI
ncbi:ergothioneine biosynthesis protein EgtB [Halobacteriovorax sp. RT-2-1]|uniref:ergothioneine biosynthesis protein EgtB n=1 Tax=Halobacteriovorax sp. RT-2-1 TaxID=3391164 RepID=UPI00399C1FC0